jgi:hypothetical protein
LFARTALDTRSLGVEVWAVEWIVADIACGFDERIADVGLGVRGWLSVRRSLRIRRLNTGIRI